MNGSSATTITNTASPFTLIVAVGSTNPSKIRSVQQALDQILLQSRPSAAAATTNPITTTTNNADGTIPTPVVIRLYGYAVASGVADQPYGDEMTLMGAKNRARAALEAHTKEFDGVEPHMAVGLEGGLIVLDAESSSSSPLACMAWMAVYGRRTTEVLQCMTNTAVPPNGGGGDDTNADSNSDMSLQHNYDNDDYCWGLAKTASFLLPPKLTQLIREEGMELGDADDVVFSRIQSKHGSGTVGILTHGLIDRSNYYEHALILALVPWIQPELYPQGH
jgi:non-canonical (house-cleaning) NTP pyrophosphatase